MNTLLSMTKRNIKLFFKDKGMFFTSLITPIILLVLYATFLGKVYRDSFAASMPDGLIVSDALINGTVSGQLISSLLAVSCITVAFCSNFLMVSDKVTGVSRDFAITPVKKSTLSISYFLATLITTLIITYSAVLIGLVYIAITGWFYNVIDVILILLDVTILTMFGTALSSIINYFLKSQGQLSAVGTVISAGYGFVCGAYMPISQFGIGLQRVLMFLPGTYGTSLIRNHSLAGVLRQMTIEGFPVDVVEKIKDSIDCNIYFFDNKIGIGVMYGVVIGTIALLLGINILINTLSKKRKIS